MNHYILICTLYLLSHFYSGVVFAAGHEAKPDTSMAKFEQLSRADWQEVFFDSCTSDWRKNWTLDGKKATIKNGVQGMDFIAGPTFRDDSSHAVLWTKSSFSGDIKIDYTYTKLDTQIRAVTILYIFATGSGIDPYKKDIAQWSHLREVPKMSKYFKNMHAYHISYAAYPVNNTDPAADYIRARRYLPVEKNKLRDTDLIPDYFETGLFKKGISYEISVIKKGDDLFMLINDKEQELLCHWKTDIFPPVVEGRIGLRHMYTRGARYRDFRISIQKTRK